MTFPFGTWIAGYRREWLHADLLAGLTAAAVVIPQAMAYAAIADLPVEAGLYTALGAMLVYPIFGSSRPLSVTTTSSIGMLTAAQVAQTSMGGGADPLAVAATLALLVGGILILARLLRLGFLADFISLPVLVGFKSGVGVVILVGQLKSILGVHVTSRSTLGTLLELPGLLGQTHALTVLVVLIGISIVVALPRLFPRLSAPLIWVALSIAGAAAFGLAERGVASIGGVPSGLPRPALPDLSIAAGLWPAALGIALMSFTESMAAARAFHRRGDAPIRADRELLAIGLANGVSGLLGGLPSGGGTSQTAVADSAGVRSQLAQWVGAAAVLFTLLLLSSAIALLPKPALAVLIVMAAVSMIKPEAFRAIARVRRLELGWAFATLAGVILIGTLEGILIAVAISILTLFYQATRPPVYAVAYNRKLRIFRRAGEQQQDETFAGLLMMRVEGRLNFASAAHAAEQMRALAEQTEARVIVLECSAIPDIEYTALSMLTEAEQNLRERGVTLWLSTINPDLLKIIQRSRLGAALGEDRIFFNLHKVLEAWETMVSPDSPERGVRLTLL